jgi:hypothetical protein
MFSEGQTIVQRGLHHDGRVGAVESARVVRDGADALVTWIGPRSAVVRRATVSGEPIRYMQLADKLDIPTAAGRRIRAERARPAPRPPLPVTACVPDDPSGACRTVSSRLAARGSLARWRSAP